MNRVFGSYVLEERIGVGGMGEVYRATKSGPEGFEVRVAVKLILPHLAQEESFRRQFSREARLAALLKHPNIVHVNGFEILDGSPFIEMEYVDGSDLASILKNLGEGEKLPLEESAYILHCAARGLAYAHSFGGVSGSDTGIIHRDFNPQNLLLSVEGEVKIADFGIARAALGGTAASGTLMGKFAYMSPEQIDGRNLDHRSDLFSLGITAYQLLSGHHPFRRASEAGTVRAVQEASFRPLSESIPSLPPTLSRTVDLLLSVSPEDRPDSAQHVADAFEEHMTPASVKMVGQRVRDTAGSAPRTTGKKPTAPTLPLRSKAYLAWPAILLILAVLLVIGLRDKTDQALQTEETASDTRPIGMPPRQADVPDSAVSGLDQVTVLVKSTPSGARISEGEEILGRTPLHVTIRAGETSKELTASLDRYEQVNISVTRDKADSGLAIALVPLPTATMRVGAIPWARVRFMGEDMGVTPVVIEDTVVGRHNLILSNSELGVRREVEVNVREGVNPVCVVDMGTGRIVKGK